MTIALGISAEAQETYRFAQRDTCSLYLDIFRAAEGSETTFQGKAKPTVMFVFGGGFIMGQRTDSFVQKWFDILNSEGYDVVTIDYRLGMKDYKVGKGLWGGIQGMRPLCPRRGGRYGGRLLRGLLPGGEQGSWNRC